MEFKYIIVQAGGKGTRLGKQTRNKPKALVSVNNLPLIFYLFNLYKNKKFFIIADYKKDVLKKYLNLYAKVDYKIIETSETNTCSGIKDALSFIPNNHPFLLIWSDLLIKEKFKFEKISKSAIGLSHHFNCRWSFNNGKFEETPSTQNGVSGCFLFKNKSEISDIPSSGEFVRYLSTKNLDLETFNLINGDEIGTIEKLNSYKKSFQCRPFNEIYEKENRIIKKPISKQGYKIAKYEIIAYKAFNSYNLSFIPKLYNYHPIEMDRINGLPPYDLKFTLEDKKLIIKNIVSNLSYLHSLRKCKTDIKSILDNYYLKTIKRINEVKSLIPFNNKKTVKVNDLDCLNIYENTHILKSLVYKYLLDSPFCLIHGDCNLSNIIVKDKATPMLIDPRGYFGKTKLYGDPYYDWSKLYYSIYGNYDQFNFKNFTLKINDDSISLSIGSNGYEELESYFFSLIPNCNIKKIKLIHAIIWLSLTTYAWDDYDSICGSYYNGIYHLTKFINDEEKRK